MSDTHLTVSGAMKIGEHCSAMLSQTHGDRPEAFKEKLDNGIGAGCTELKFTLVNPAALGIPAAATKHPVLTVESDTYMALNEATELGHSTTHGHSAHNKFGLGNLVFLHSISELHADSPTRVVKAQVAIYSAKKEAGEVRAIFGRLGSVINEQYATSADANRKHLCTAIAPVVQNFTSRHGRFSFQFSDVRSDAMSPENTKLLEVLTSRSPWSSAEASNLVNAAAILTPFEQLVAKLHANPSPDAAVTLFVYHTPPDSHAPLPMRVGENQRGLLVRGKQGRMQDLATCLRDYYMNAMPDSKMPDVFVQNEKVNFDDHPKWGPVDEARKSTVQEVRLSDGFLVGHARHAWVSGKETTSYKQGKDGVILTYEGVKIINSDSSKAWWSRLCFANGLPTLTNALFELMKTNFASSVPSRGFTEHIYHDVVAFLAGTADRNNEAYMRFATETLPSFADLKKQGKQGFWKTIGLGLLTVVDLSAEMMQVLELDDSKTVVKGISRRLTLTQLVAALSRARVEYAIATPRPKTDASAAGRAASQAVSQAGASQAASQELGLQDDDTGSESDDDDNSEHTSEDDDGPADVAPADVTPSDASRVLRGARSPSVRAKRPALPEDPISMRCGKRSRPPPRVRDGAGPSGAAATLRGGSGSRTPISKRGKKTLTKKNVTALTKEVRKRWHGYKRKTNPEELVNGAAMLLNILLNGLGQEPISFSS